MIFSNEQEMNFYKEQEVNTYKKGSELLNEQEVNC